MSNGAWIDFPRHIPLFDTAPPALIRVEDVDQVTKRLTELGATVGSATLASVRSESDLFAQLRSVLTFPDWCGSNWNAFEDAFNEILSASNFPLFVLVHDLEKTLSRDVHLALEAVIILNQIERAFSSAGAQFAVIYPGVWRSGAPSNVDSDASRASTGNH
jgi:hypothetical protein